MVNISSETKYNFGIVSIVCLTITIVCIACISLRTNNVKNMQFYPELDRTFEGIVFLNLHRIYGIKCLK